MDFLSKFYAIEIYLLLWTQNLKINVYFISAKKTMCLWFAYIFYPIPCMLHLFFLNQLDCADTTHKRSSYIFTFKGVL